jgi:hypothetical protein
LVLKSSFGDSNFVESDEPRVHNFKANFMERSRDTFGDGKEIKKSNGGGNTSNIAINWFNETSNLYQNYNNNHDPTDRNYIQKLTPVPVESASTIRSKLKPNQGHEASAFFNSSPTQNETFFDKAISALAPIPVSSESNIMPPPQKSKVQSSNMSAWFNQQSSLCNPNQEKGQELDPSEEAEDPWVPKMKPVAILSESSIGELPGQQK